MAVYSKKQMTRDEKPRPQVGTHIMKVRKEMASTKSGSQHVFILANNYSEIWFNCFLPDIPQFAEACGVFPDSNGDVDTAEVVNKFVVIKIEDREYKGKTYANVADFRPIGAEDDMSDALQPAEEDDNGINF